MVPYQKIKDIIKMCFQGAYGIHKKYPALYKVIISHTVGKISIDSVVNACKKDNLDVPDITNFDYWSRALNTYSDEFTIINYPKGYGNPILGKQAFSMEIGDKTEIDSSYENATAEVFDDWYGSSTEYAAQAISAFYDKIYPDIHKFPELIPPIGEIAFRGLDISESILQKFVKKI